MRMFLIKLTTILGICVLPLIITAQQKFGIGDLGKFAALYDPQISPDGKSVALVVSRPDYELNRYKTDLTLVEVSTGKHRVLTNERIYLSQPRWSPTGEHISFLAKTITPKDATMQLFVLPMSGGEAKQITHASKGVQHYSWSPDGEWIAFATADEGVSKEKMEKGYDAFEVGNNDMFLTSARTPTHIWLVSSKGGEAKRLTSGKWSLPVTIPPGSPSSPLSWSADGKTIAFVKSFTTYSGDGFKRTTHLLNVADGTMKPMTTHKMAEGYPIFSYDGSRIAYHYLRDGQPGNLNDIWVTSPDGSDGKNISINLDRDIYRALWFPDNKHLLIGGHDDNRTSLWIQSIDGTSKKLNLGGLSPNGFYWLEIAVGKNGSIAFVATTPSQPSELYFMSHPNETPKKLTAFNSVFKDYSFGKAETLRWSFESFDHNGIVTYPVNYTTSKAYPLILIIHGGPNSASLEAFNTLTQIFANKGYVVFQPNYRGSDNMGLKYKTANIKDFGPGPGRDIMAGLQKLKSSVRIDTTRMAVSGWSYGGYMTAWLASHHNIWKAAVAGAAVTDLTDQYNLSDGNVAMGERFGSPYKGSALYVQQSPITYAHQIKAPMLILANTLDPRVPVSHSYKLYHALKDNDVKTKFIAWPIAMHNANDPVRQKEVYKYWTEWIDQHLGEWPMNTSK